jgi:hypothetical protein
VDKWNRFASAGKPVFHCDDQKCGQPRHKGSVFFSWFACGVIDAHADIRRNSAMARPETTGRRIGSTEADAFSIAEFCQRHGISIAMYYKMRAQDPKSVPREIHVGTRRLISKEAAADWRAERERETAKQNA